MMGADVVRAALEDGRRQVHAEGRRKGRDVLLKELVLKGLAGRRDDDDGARENGRNEVGEALARARARLGEERLLAFDRARHGERELDLPRPGAEPGRGPGDGAVLGEGLGDALGEGPRGVKKRFGA